MTICGRWTKGPMTTLGLVAGVVFLGASLCYSEPVTHEVRKGDTLWDLSEHYYGNHSLWPKLWEMNPFVTNPHLLREGDVLKLFDSPPQQIPPRQFEIPSEAVPSAPIQVRDSDFDVSSLVDETYLGFFSFDPVIRSGRIIADQTPRLMLAEGDPVFVLLDPGVKAAPGDSFMIYRIAGEFRDSDEGRRRGRAVTFKGKIVLSQELKDGIFEAVIEDSLESISVGDPLLPAFPVGNCISMQPHEKTVHGSVIAFRHGHELVGRFDVVYLNRGSLHGLQRGSMLHIHRDAGGFGSLTDRSLPLPPLGSLVVLATMADSATALVLETGHEVPLGAAVSTVTGEQLNAMASMLPACTPDRDARKTLD